MSDGPLSWSPRTGRWQTSGAGEVAFAAADSWLVEDGRVRALGRHRERFAAAVAGAGARGAGEAITAPGGAPGAADVARFLDAVAAALPRTGRWFPRVELAAPDGELRLWLRAAPAPLDEVVVHATPFVDRRRAPTVKGPDFPRQHAWRAAAEAVDAGEALLSAPAGTVNEGVWSTPLWWDGDVLCALPRGAPVLGSVTRELVLGLARELGVAVGREAPSVARLRDSETWMLSALHGIRRVSGWLLVPGQPPEPAPYEPGRAVAWQERLRALAASLDG